MTRSASSLAKLMSFLGVGMIIFSACLAISMTSNNASAEGPTTVRGHVYGHDGNPAPGAQVVVKFLGETKTWSGSTDSNGFYDSRVAPATTWGPGEWKIGDTIEVTVTYNSEVLVTTKLAVDYSYQTVDVHYELLIPQLGGLIGSLIAAATVGVVAIVFVQKKRPTT